MRLNKKIRDLLMELLIAIDDGDSKNLSLLDFLREHGFNKNKKMRLFDALQKLKRTIAEDREYSKAHRSA